MNTQSTVGTALLKSLITLREQKGTLTMEDVGGMFERIASSLQPADEASLFLKKEIEKLASFMDKAKEEIASIRPENEEGTTATGDASLQLDAVIKATEEASNAIMNAADAIQAQAAGVGGEKEQAIMDATMQIYEACSFQDLTSQRVTKVMKLLSDIDERVNNILTMFSSSGLAVKNPDAKNSGGNVIAGEFAGKPFAEKDLLNGPQLGATPSQADIDALFANFKP